MKIWNTVTVACVAQVDAEGDYMSGGERFLSYRFIEGKCEV